MKKILLTFTMLLMMAFAGRAQEKGLYLTVGGSLGANKYQYQLDNGNTSTPRLGFGGSLGIQYFFTKHWGLASGVGLTFYNSQGKYNNDYQKDPNHYSFQDMYDDDFRYLGIDDKSYTLQLGLSDWKEIQQGYFFEVPLMLMYQTKWGAKEAVGMYFGVGAKVQLPVISQRYEVSNGSELSVSAYYSKPDVVFPDPEGPDLSKHGYGQNTKTGYTGDMDIKKTSFAASGEVGFLFGLSPRVDLTVGAYLDYGLTNIKDGNKTEEGYLINPENGAKTIQPSTYVGDHLAYNGYINSHAVDKTNLLAMGGKIGIRIKLCKPSERKMPAETMYNEKDTVYLTQFEKDTVYLSQTTKDTVIIQETPDKSLAVPTKEEIKILSESIFFDLDKDILLPKATATLDSMVFVLKKYPDLQLLITGNTCDLGTSQHNINLGLRRALSAEKYLINKGIDKSRISVASQSSESPIFPNTNEQNREQNRRCDFHPKGY